MSTLKSLRNTSEVRDSSSSHHRCGTGSIGSGSARLLECEVGDAPNDALSASLRNSNIISDLVCSLGSLTACDTGKKGDDDRNASGMQASAATRDGRFAAPSCGL